MMWPVLTKVQYERLPELAMERKLWYQIALSLFLNWIIGGWQNLLGPEKGRVLKVGCHPSGPFLMLGIAWATLPVCTYLTY